MKYLKNYKIYESISDMEQDIKEICYDITDYGGFEIDMVRDVPGRKYLQIFKPKYVDFDFDEVKEVCLMVKNYLGDKYKMSKYFPSAMGLEGKIHGLELFLDDDFNLPMAGKDALWLVIIEYEIS